MPIEVFQEIPSHSIEKFLQIKKVLIERLKNFEHIPTKHIIFGGDFGGEIAIKLMEEIYGESNFKIYSVILPCYPERLKEDIFNFVNTRKNAIQIDLSSLSCQTDMSGQIVTKGLCSKISDIVTENEKTPSLEVCGCFFSNDSFQNFQNYHLKGMNPTLENFFREYYSQKTDISGQKNYLYLFQGIKEDDCDFFYFAANSEEKFQGYKKHMCKIEEQTKQGEFEKRFIIDNYRQEILDRIQKRF